MYIGASTLRKLIDKYLENSQTLKVNNNFYIFVVVQPNLAVFINLRQTELDLVGELVGD